MEVFNEQLADEILEETRIQLVEAVKRAYDTALDVHDPASGSNNSTFGHDLYWYCVHELKEIAQDESSPLELIRERPDFRLRIGSYILACHRVGTDAQQDISISFPNNNRAAGHLARSNNQQLFLPGFEDKELDPMGGSLMLNVVLAHIGNPTDGACAIYLCLPINEENGRIMSWGYTKLLWKADELNNFTTTTQKLPEEAPIEPGTVRLKPRKREEEKNGGDI